MEELPMANQRLQNMSGDEARSSCEQYAGHFRDNLLLLLLLLLLIRL